MGPVKFGKSGGGEVIIKDGGGETFIVTAHMYVPTYRQWPPPPPPPPFFLADVILNKNNREPLPSP